MSVANDIFSCALALNTIADRVEPETWTFLRVMRDNLQELSLQAAHMESGLFLAQPQTSLCAEESHTVQATQTGQQ